jgi:hypothetical protein
MGYYVVCGSHRARDKLIGRGDKRQCYHLAFTDHDMTHKGIYAVTEADLPRALKITWVRRLPQKKVPHLRRCW